MSTVLPSDPNPILPTPGPSTPIVPTPVPTPESKFPNLNPFSEKPADPTVRKTFPGDVRGDLKPGDPHFKAGSREFGDPADFPVSVTSTAAAAAATSLQTNAPDTANAVGTTPTLITLFTTLLPALMTLFQTCIPLAARAKPSFQGKSPSDPRSLGANAGETDFEDAAVFNSPVAPTAGQSAVDFVNEHWDEKYGYDPIVLGPAITHTLRHMRSTGTRTGRVTRYQARDVAIAALDQTRATSSTDYGTFMTEQGVTN